MKPEWSFFLFFVSLNIFYPVSLGGGGSTAHVETTPRNYLRIAQGKVSPDQTPGLGTEETPRVDGGKDTIYYSIVTPEEEKRKQDEEKQKQDKSWDTLKNIIIDNRRIR